MQRQFSNHKLSVALTSMSNSTNFIYGNIIYYHKKTKVWGTSIELFYSSVLNFKDEQSETKWLETTEN